VVDGSQNLLVAVGEPLMTILLMAREANAKIMAMVVIFFHIFQNK
jgi:hypothetical protein